MTIVQEVSLIPMSEVFTASRDEVTNRMVSITLTKNDFLVSSMMTFLVCNIPERVKECFKLLKGDVGSGLGQVHLKVLK